MTPQNPRNKTLKCGLLARTTRLKKRQLNSTEHIYPNDSYYLKIIKSATLTLEKSLFENMQK
jgi:hypothetical protein